MFDIVKVDLPAGWTHLLTRFDCYKIVAESDVPWITEWDLIEQGADARGCAFLIQEDLPPYGPLLVVQNSQGATIQFWDCEFGWDAHTPSGWVKKLWLDKVGTLLDVVDACGIIDEVCRTGQPPSGGWA